MSATNATTYYELSQFVDGDKPTFLGNYNSDMLKIDNGIHEAAADASTAISTANAASSAASAASTSASAAVTTANAASATASEASNTAGTALTNAGAALTAAQNAENKAKANDITNLAPAYDSTLTYDVGDLVTYVDDNGTGKLYKCIIAVSTPEAFNINKWDDVTMSEVYYPKVINSVTSDGVKTWGELLTELLDSLTFDVTKMYIIRRTTPDNLNVSYYSQFVTPSSIRCGSLSIGGNYYIEIGFMYSGRFITFKIDYTNTVTNSDDTNDVPDSGNIITLIETY